MGKRFAASEKSVDQAKLYSVEDGFGVLEGFQAAKFDETVDVAIRLGVDPKKSDQMVRGSVRLPNGLGRKVRVLVFAKGEKAGDGEKAGAEYVGAEEYIAKIEQGWLEFDKVIATPDMMAVVSKVAKILGPRGLMPNPKAGTVTMDVTKAVTEVKAGLVEFRMDKGGVVHAPIGKRSFGQLKLQENYQALMDAVQKAKPATAKGHFIRSITVSATMSPGVHLSVSSEGAKAA